MKISWSLCLSALLLLSANLSFAQPTEPWENEGQSLSEDPVTGDMTYQWWGKSGRTYFIQSSEDLMDWTYIPIIEPGIDDWVEWGFSFTADSIFLRLKFSDIPTTNPDTADFDGDNIGNWAELLQETDPFAALDLNGNGIPDDWELFWNDRIGVYPAPITASLSRDSTSVQFLYLNNPVSPDADFTVTVSGDIAGSFLGYEFEDSLTGNVLYEWTEIAATGTLLTDISDHDNASQEVIFQSITFPFYGIDLDRLYATTDGVLAFFDDFVPWGGDPIPYWDNPDGFIALFWDDLDTNDGSANDAGEIYYQEFSDRVVFQYDGVTRDSDDKTATNTFQAILHENGEIGIRYKELDGFLEDATVGIENPDGDGGIEVVHDGPYLEANLALKFRPAPVTFVSVSPLSGTTPEGGVSSLAVTFDSTDLRPGIYTADIEIAHTGTGVTPWTIPAILEVRNEPAEITLTEPSSESWFWLGEGVTLRATGSDSDYGLERVDFYAEDQLLGSDSTASYQDYWVPTEPGVYDLTARAVDRFGTVTISDPIPVRFVEDADGDLMPDDWERDHFDGEITHEASTDADDDGFPNIFEYHFGTDPNVSSSKPAFSNEQEYNSPDPRVGNIRYFIVGGDSDTEFRKSSIRNAVQAANDFDIIEVEPGFYPGTLNLYDRVYLFSSDELPDWIEAHGITEATVDTDGDTLGNLAEYATHGTDPRAADADGDQLDDAAELTAGTNPSNADTDGDELPDGWEVLYGLDPLDETTGDGDPARLGPMTIPPIRKPTTTPR